MTEDEMVAALQRASGVYELTKEAPSIDTYAARALLDAVRLILEPFEGECVYCGWPINANQEQHAEDCPALPWVLAAARAGL